MYPRWSRGFSLLVVAAFIFSNSYSSNLCFAQATEAVPAIQQAVTTPSPVVVGPGDVALSDLKSHGISLQNQLIYDWSRAFSDSAPSSGFGRYSYDLYLPVDGEKLLGLKGSDAMLRLKHHMRHFGNDCVGESQLYSNIDANSRTILYEAWVEQKVLSDKLRFKGGKIDANTEFAVVQNAGDFLNSSMGFSPTIVAFPTYPEPKLGFNAFYRGKSAYTAGVGVFQTAGLGRLTVVEPGRNWNVESESVPGRVSVGYWRLDGGTIPQYDGKQTSGAQGFYSVLEQSLYRSKSSSRGVSGFLQLGTAEGRISPFTHHVGGGAILQNPCRKRAKDSLGIATTWVRFTSYPRAGFDFASETVVEGYYKATLTSHVSFVQDVQYFHHPGGLRANPDTPVITPRLVISF